MSVAVIGDSHPEALNLEEALKENSGIFQSNTYFLAYGGRTFHKILIFVFLQIYCKIYSYSFLLYFLGDDGAPPVAI